MVRSAREREVKFVRAWDPFWISSANAVDWKKRSESGQASKRFLCPRCGHMTTLVDHGEGELVPKGKQPTTTGKTGRKPRKYAACNCAIKHPETPEGEIGCGAHGLIERPCRIQRP